MAAGDQYTHTVLGNGHLVIVKADAERWGDDGRMVNPPRIFVLYYDLHSATAVAEPISFLAAAALVPDKHAVVTKELGRVRSESGYVRAALAVVA